MVIGIDIIQKTREDYNKIAQHFSGTRYDIWPELEQLKPLFKNGQCILDWGCGNGRLLLMLQEKKDVQYIGIDQSEALITIARQKHRQAITKGRARFYCTARRVKKFPKNYFDLACFIASFHHLPGVASRLSVLREAYRELKPGGKLIMTVWNLGSDWAKAKQKKDWEQVGPSDWFIPWKDYQTGKIITRRYYHHFIPAEIRELVTEAGFKVEKTDYGPGPGNTEKGGRNLIVIAVKK